MTSNNSVGRPVGSWAGIEEFFHVAQARNFSAAARILGISTSQISRQIAQLEERLGRRLLYRTTRRVSLTEAGEQFLQRCQRLIEDRDQALQEIGDESGELHGLLRVTCSERFVVPMINRFILQHPQLNADVLLWNEALDLVEEGIDLAVRFGRLSDSRLVAVRLGSRTIRLCAAPAYLERRGTPADPAALHEHDGVIGHGQAWSFSVDGQPFGHAPRGRFLSNGGDAQLDSLLAGLGLCQLPDFYVDEHLRSGALVEVLERYRPPQEAVWALYPNRKHVPLKVKLAVQHLQREFAAPARPPL